jgi:EAL domain-containing protein (putative c-di-GMP-specific phosphodiesterase class I)
VATIDDFGTGRVRLVDLRRFPVDTWLMRSLINNLLADPGESRCSGPHPPLAVKLNKKVVAGRRKNCAVEQLRALGCKFGQEYFYSQPLEAPRPMI